MSGSHRPPLEDIMNLTLTLLRFGRGHRLWWRARLERALSSLSGMLSVPTAVPVRVRASRLPLMLAVLAVTLGLSNRAFAQDRSNEGRWGRNDYYRGYQD